jgi:hypothetical protein
MFSGFFHCYFRSFQEPVLRVERVDNAKLPDASLDAESPLIATFPTSVTVAEAQIVAIYIAAKAMVSMIYDLYANNGKLTPSKLILNHFYANIFQRQSHLQRQLLYL